MNPQRHSIGIIDHGLQRVTDTVAMDHAWLRDHAQGRRGNLLRFYRHRPGALIGHHQRAAQELRLDYCARRGIDTARRSSGGGALYLDEGQLCFSLIVDAASIPCMAAMTPLLEFFCSCLAGALDDYHLQPCFKAPNDLELDGRKLASGFVTLLDGSVLFQGVLLLEVDMASTLKALRVPTEKLSRDGLAGARQRVTTLTEQLQARNLPLPQLPQLQAQITRALCRPCRLRPEPLARHLAPDPQSAHAQPVPCHQNPDASDSDTQDEGLLEAKYRSPGGWLQARIWLGGKSGHIAHLELNGSLHCAPHDALQRLARWLEGAHPSSVRQRIESFFRQHPVDMPGVAPGDIGELLRLALMRVEQQQGFALSPQQANRIMCANIAPGQELHRISAQASVMLVPYCAKPAFCKWRHLDNCTECGKCEVGDAYALGRARGMRIISINNYEHLSTTLEQLKSEKIASLIGMCCENFYIKRNHAFTDSGIPMLLLDIHGATCYELGEEEEAYAGTFSAEAKLDLPLLRGVMGEIKQ